MFSFFFPWLWLKMVPINFVLDFSPISTSIYLLGRKGNNVHSMLWFTHHRQACLINRRSGQCSVAASKKADSPTVARTKNTGPKKKWILGCQPRLQNHQYLSQHVAVLRGNSTLLIDQAPSWTEPRTRLRASLIFIGFRFEDWNPYEKFLCRSFDLLYWII